MFTVGGTMELRDIEIFLTLAEELHFGRTAERLHVTPSRVSQAIKKQERRIGAPLFHRTTRKVVLTDLGHLLHAEMKPHYKGIQDALDHVAATAGRPLGTLRAGFINAMWSQLFVRAADTVQADHPGTRIALREYLGGDALQPLHNGDADVICASYPIDEPGLTAGPVLLREAPLLVVPSSHPLAERDSVSMEDLSDVQLLSTPTMPAVWTRDRIPQTTPGGRPIQAGPEVTSVSQALSFIAAGRGAFIFGDQTMSYHHYSGITLLPIRDGRPLEWGLVHVTQAQTPLLRAFARALTTLVNSADKT